MRYFKFIALFWLELVFFFVRSGDLSCSARLIGANENVETIIGGQKDDFVVSGQNENNDDGVHIRANTIQENYQRQLRLKPCTFYQGQRCCPCPKDNPIGCTMIHAKLGGHERCASTKAQQLLFNSQGYVCIGLWACY